MKLGHRVGAALTAGLLLSSCAAERNFDDREGDIIAGEPVTVIEPWHTTRQTGKHGPEGYILYLVTEDCKTGATPLDGPGIAAGCKANSHEVTPGDYRNYKDGDPIQWTDRKSPSEVVEHRRGRGYYYETVHDFGLLVRQCVTTPGTELGQTCVEDFVEVDADTWYHAEEGQILTFSGNKGKVISG